MATKKEEVAVADFDRKEFQRTLAIIKQEIGALVNDAQRKSPLFSKTPEEAKAKAVSIQKSFTEFVSFARSLKDED